MNKKNFFRVIYIFGLALVSLFLGVIFGLVISVTIEIIMDCAALDYGREASYIIWSITAAGGTMLFFYRNYKNMVKSADKEAQKDWDEIITDILIFLGSIVFVALAIFIIWYLHSHLQINWV